MVNNSSVSTYLSNTAGLIIVSVNKMSGLVSLSVTRSAAEDAAPVERRFDTDLTLQQLKVFLIISLFNYFSNLKILL